LLPAGLQLAFGALSTTNYSLAIEAATRVLEAHPDSIDTLVLRANAHAHSKLDPDAALADVDRILELDPENMEAMEPRILALLSLERIDDAAEAIDELGRRIDAAETGANVPAWHCATTAIFADENEQPDLAEERWTQCLELHPANANVVTGAVGFYDAQQKFDRSLEILRRAHAEVPESRDYRVTLALRLRAAGKADEAEALLREPTANENLTIAAGAWLDLAKHQQALVRGRRPRASHRGPRLCRPRRAIR
jgi:tetratricopeptide (TPR) repeat protein